MTAFWQGAFMAGKNTHNTNDRLRFDQEREVRGDRSMKMEGGKDCAENGPDEEVAAAVMRSFPRLSSDEQKISLLIYRLLSEGNPVNLGCLSEKSGLGKKEIATFLMSRSGLRTIEYDDRQRIVGFAGLSLMPTHHKFYIGPERLYSWCAWDALFLPELLQKTAKIVSCCPVSGMEIRLTVSPEEIHQYSPLSSVMSFRIPEPSVIQGQDMVHRFCCDIRFFANSDQTLLWVAEKKEVVIFGVREAYALARIKNFVQYPELFPENRNMQS